MRRLRWRGDHNHEPCSIDGRDDGATDRRIFATEHACRDVPDGGDSIVGC